MAQEKKYSGLEIAVIGMSGRFHESRDHRHFWKNLKAGKELIQVFTEEDLKKRGVSERMLRSEGYVPVEGVMEDKEYFDPAFFGYTSEEASLMDPQIRVFHEQCWSALEDAGYASMTGKIKIGLYAGASANENWKIHVYNTSADAAVNPFFLSSIASHNYISSLISYKLDLRGPALFVDTACSTSLVAIHLACRSLIMKECAVALAGGVSLSSRLTKGYLHQEGMIFSKDGHCRTFDAEASGTIAGEGAGVVVLKRLGDALKDNDHIYCVVLATAINNDGRHKVGYTAPSVDGQVDCIANAQRLAGIQPSDIGYIEAHGTATALGDPIEWAALNQLFRTENSKKYCAIGSVKSNLGHCDAAAGIAGFIKTALSLRHRQLPASLHFQVANPRLDPLVSPLYVNTQLKEWKNDDNKLLRAGVSSFGIGGTNAHAILEQPPSPDASRNGRKYQLLILSARTEQSLTRYISLLKDFLLEYPETDPADMAWTLQAGRRSFEYRKYMAFDSREELNGSLDAATRSKVYHNGKANDARVVFMFSGAGSQYVNMGKGLYEHERYFREEMDKGFEALYKLTGENYKGIFFPSDPSDVRINEMLYTQPAIFLFGYCLARLLLHWGVRPACMIGHSIGEYVAASISGVFSFEDALKLVVTRGELMNKLEEGGMVSATLASAKAAQYVAGDISLAAVNGPEQVVFSGTDAAMRGLMQRLDKEGISYSQLHASRAGHSYMMESIIDEYKQALAKTQVGNMSIPFVSNVTGSLIEPREAGSSIYWARHMRETVRFSEGIKYLVQSDKEMVFLEMGGSNSLTSLLRLHNTGSESPVGINLVRHPKDQTDDVLFLTRQLGELWAAGVPVDWHAYHQGENRRKVSLPTYSFEAVKYPAEVDPWRGGVLASQRKDKLQELKDWIYRPGWKTSYLQDVTKADTEGVCLFFSRSDVFEQSVVNDLKTDGMQVVEVVLGRCFEQPGPDRYVVNPFEIDSIGRVMSDLKRREIDVSHVVYAWGMGLDASALELEKENEEMNRWYFYLANIVQALLPHGKLSEKRFFILTDRLFPVAGNEEVGYGQSLMIGLGNVLPQEYGAACINIDVDLPNTGAQSIRAVVKEILSPHLAEERQVAIRWGQRWVKEYQQWKTIAADAEPVLRQKGVYLITGGLGDLGFLLAKHLIKKYNARLILAGRKDRFVDSITGGEWVARLEHLEKMGEVYYMTADVTKPDDFERAILQAETQTGPINGIIHAAGNIDLQQYELIGDITPQATFSVMSAKVKGIKTLYNLFKDKPLDFVWMTSSLATVLGGLGFSAYSAANLYMDSFTTAMASSLNNWKCVDLAEMLFDDETVLKEDDYNRKALKPGEILSFFEWSIAVRGCSVIMITVRNLLRRIGDVYTKKDAAYLDETFKSDAVRRMERPKMTIAYVAPATDMERRVTDIFEGFFGIADIGVEDNFYELGGDSLKGMMLLKRIKKEFSVHLPLKEFLSNITIRAVAARIDELSWLKAGADMENEVVI